MWRPIAMPPAFAIIGPYFFNKLIYIYFPSYLAFVATDYACRALSLALLYLLLRDKPHSFPIPWKLAILSNREVVVTAVGISILIGSLIVGMTSIQYLNNHSWRLTRFPLPSNSLLQGFDISFGMIFVASSEEAIFRFYLINLLLLRRVSFAAAVIVSALVFAGIHWSYGAGTTLFSMFGGLVLGSIFVAARNLTAPIVAHAVFDALVFTGAIGFLWNLYNRV
jgi:membrane protease YdiL (CAAX protease family)